MKRILTAILLVAFCVSPIAAQELTGTLQQIKKTGKIRIGYRHSQPPMSFLGKDGKPVGYSIDLGNHIVDAIKNKIGSQIAVEYVPVTAEDRFTALSENKIDILCGATTKTLSRGELVDFTQLTFITGASFMTLRGKKIKNEFEGKKIGVVQNTTTAAELKKLFQKTSINAEIILFNSTVQGFAALKKEEIDAFSGDQVVLIGLALSTNNPGNFNVLSELFSFEPFAFAVRRNDADFRLIADRVISDLYRTKQIVEMYIKWFGEFSTSRSSGFNALIQINAIPE